MPQCTHTTTVHAPLSATWAFVREMDNWAPLLTGYQGHEKQDDKRSVWTLRGDVGMLSREVQLQVEITEWIEGERVEFTLKGINEQVDGGGTFEIGVPEGAVEVQGAVEVPPTSQTPENKADVEVPPTSQTPENKADVEVPPTSQTPDGDADTHPAGWFARLVAWIARTLFAAQHGHTKALAPADETPTPAATATEPPTSQLKFRLEMNAGGPMAPMINPMLQPALLPATEDLATKIANAVLQGLAVDATTDD